jgi:hypothetical protein
MIIINLTRKNWKIYLKKKKNYSSIQQEKKTFIIKKNNEKWKLIFKKV